VLYPPLQAGNQIEEAIKMNQASIKLIVLDTETTGLSPKKGHRIVEIGAIEIDACGNAINTFHHYINPDCHIPAQVVRVHGIDDEAVEGKPYFADIANEFLSFVEGATLVIHNASFDIGFLEHELSLCKRSGIKNLTVIDTLKIARKKFKGEKNDLDSLCRRYNIHCEHRQLHGALLDAKLLAEVYVALNGE